MRIRRKKYPNITSEFLAHLIHIEIIQQKIIFRINEWIIKKENKIAIFDATNTTINEEKINRYYKHIQIDDLKICSEILDMKIINKNIEMTN